MKLSGSQLLIEGLKAEGVRYVFGASGTDTLPILDVIYDESQMRYIQTQHEQGAIYMANGYARAARTAGICLVSPGPGITNCHSGVSQAYYTSTPSLLIGIEESTRFYGLGASLHHDLDGVSVFKPVTKLSLRIERADRILEGIRMAFRTALSGRKGPVYLGIAKDILMDQAECEVLPPERYRAGTMPKAQPESIATAAELLVAAQNPVALAGGGLAWSQGQEALLSLAELLGMPVAESRDNKGLIPGDHPLALSTVGLVGNPVAVKTVQKADVLLTLGCTFGEFTTRGFGYEVVPKGARIIQVDIDPSEIGKIYPVDVGIVGDARSVLQDLLEEVRGRKIDRRPVEQLPRIKEILRMKREFHETILSQKTWGKVPIQWPRLLHDLRQALPRDAIVSAVTGSTSIWFEYGFEALTYTRNTGGWHPLGSEYPESLGVKVALPDHVVVCLTGDGSLMMTLQEIATATAYGIPLLCVVCHNDVYGNMRHSQIKHFGRRFIGTDLPIPNLANIAREFSAYGERIEKPDEIIPAVGRALASGKPAVLEVMMDASEGNLLPPMRSL